MVQMRTRKSVLKLALLRASPTNSLSCSMTVIVSQQRDTTSEKWRPCVKKSISKAIAIIENGLRASLDKKAGGEIASSLDTLYEYMNSRLLQTNLKK